MYNMLRPRQFRDYKIRKYDLETDEQYHNRLLKYATMALKLKKDENTLNIKEAIYGRRD